MSKATLVIVLTIFMIGSILTVFMGPGSQWEDLLEITKSLLGTSEDIFINDILWGVRLPKLITSIFAGMGLALCGLVLQIYFQNALAGPYLLGIQSGASLGISLWIFILSTLPVLDYSVFSWVAGGTTMAFGGAFGSMLMILYLSHFVQSRFYLVIFGLLIGHFTSGIVSIFATLSTSDKIQKYLLWSQGDFQGLLGLDLFIFAFLIAVPCAVLLIKAKQINALNLGDDYARSLGVSIRSVKRFVLFFSAWISTIVTVFCGPIIFIGVMAPHLARMVTKGMDHRFVFPMTLVLGASMGVYSSLIASSFPWFQLPLNAVLGLLGGPFLIYMAIKLKGLQ